MMMMMMWMKSICGQLLRLQINWGFLIPSILHNLQQSSIIHHRQSGHGFGVCRPSDSGILNFTLFIQPHPSPFAMSHHIHTTPCNLSRVLSMAPWLLRRLVSRVLDSSVLLHAQFMQTRSRSGFICEVVTSGIFVGLIEQYLIRCMEYLWVSVLEWVFFFLNNSSISRSPKSLECLVACQVLVMENHQLYCKVGWWRLAV